MACSTRVQQAASAGRWFRSAGALQRLLLGSAATEAPATANGACRQPQAASTFAPSAALHDWPKCRAQYGTAAEPPLGYATNYGAPKEDGSTNAPGEAATEPHIGYATNHGSPEVETPSRPGPPPGSGAQGGGPGSGGDSSASAEDAEIHAEEVRLQILEAALGHVRQKGWSMAALQAGAQQVGLSPAAAGMIPGAEAGLVEFFEEQCNARLAEKLAGMKEELAGMKTADRVKTALRLRLEMLVSYMDKWPQALAIQARPGAATGALQRRAALADEVWHAAGDAATDYNWYTKRALVAGVYAATELYMLTDFSPGYADTWASLDRRLADVARLGRAAGRVRDMAQQATERMMAFAHRRGS